VTATFTIVQPGTREYLPVFLRFIRDVCDRIEASDETRYALRLAVEEVCTNLIDYGYSGQPEGPIEVAVYDERDRVTIVIRDRSPPFDPADAPAPDLASDAEHRPVGGRGWYLVRKMIDEVDYAPATPSGNVLTLVKRKTDTQQGETRWRSK
jgi:anti-sigma regulatory factor (Ser/Thr protein kinase)